MTNRHLTHQLGVLLCCMFGLAAAGCPASTGKEARIQYDATSVKNANEMTMMGSGNPGGIFTSYQQPVEYPLSIETTAYIETKSSSGSSSDAGSNGGSSGGESGGWSRAPIEQGNVSILGDSSCSKKNVDCNEDRCVVQISMDGDGYCVVELSITAQAGVGASDCWGYGWVDGQGLSSDERQEKREELVSKRDELCG